MAELEAVLAGMREPGFQARVDAVRELRTFDDRRAFEAIVAALADSDMAVIEAAVEALVEDGSEEAADALVAALAADDEVAEHIDSLLSHTEQFIANVLARS